MFHSFVYFTGSVTSSSSVSQMASGISLVSFNSRPDGMHQRSYSVSSADQWSEATVIANSGISTGRFFFELPRSRVSVCASRFPFLTAAENSDVLSFNCNFLSK